MIDILLATYQSARFIHATLDSILQQDNQDWRLVIRDGGSEDNTQEIIRSWQHRYPDKIRVIPSQGRSCACENFSALLSASTAPYMMFCDHDDVWFPDKISKTFSAMQAAERQYRPDVPLLVFTDMQVVDERLSVLDASYFAYQHLNPDRILMRHLLVQNIPCGCTMMINRKLADSCGPIPSEAVMHDHWLSLLAATVGRIVYLSEPTMKYRQHDQNIYGARRYGWDYLVKRSVAGPTVARQRFYQNVRQAKVFVQRYGDLLDLRDREIIEDFALLDELGWFDRRRVLLRHKLFKSGWLRNIITMLIV
ncbi:MAG: glycosyltransferase family 2 protein [Anaerohalosphaeraceae bacterium]